MTANANPFWMRKTLEQLDPQEWESLCDGCGLCCLQKLEDEDDNSVYYTRIACKLLDMKTCQCSNYPKRMQIVPDCIQLTPGKAGFDVGRETTQGMPSTSTLVKPLEHYKRQRRAFRSRRLSGEPLH